MAQRGKLGLAAIGLLSLVTYFVIRPVAGNDTAALGIAWFIPVVWTLVSSVLQRRVDVFGMVGVAFYGLALVASVFLGAGSLPLKLHHAVPLVVVGTACLISIAINRPLLALVIRFYATRGLAPAGTATMLSRRTLTLLTLLIGTACIADATLQVALALTLSTAEYLLARTAVHVAIAGGAVLVFWHRVRHVRARAA